MDAVSKRHKKSGARSGISLIPHVHHVHPKDKAYRGAPLDLLECKNQSLHREEVIPQDGDHNDSLKALSLFKMCCSYYFLTETPFDMRILIQVAFSLRLVA